MEGRTHKAKKAQITGFIAPPVTRPGNISATKIPISGLKAIVPNPIASQAQKREFSGRPLMEFFEFA